MDLNRPQPDFDAMARGLQAVATEVGNMANLPAVEDGNAILQAIRDMNFNLNNRFDELRTLIAASNHNSLAFVANSHVRHAHTMLMPLHHHTTNLAIANFPATSGDISTLSVAVLDQILAALGAPTNSNRVDKKARLRTKIGLLSG